MEDRSENALVNYDISSLIIISLAAATSCLTMDGWSLAHELGPLRLGEKTLLSKPTSSGNRLVPNGGENRAVPLHKKARHVADRTIDSQNLLVSNRAHEENRLW